MYLIGLEPVLGHGQSDVRRNDLVVGKALRRQLHVAGVTDVRLVVEDAPGPKVRHVRIQHVLDIDVSTRGRIGKLAEDLGDGQGRAYACPFGQP